MLNYSRINRKLVVVKAEIRPNQNRSDDHATSGVGNAPLRAESGAGLNIVADSFMANEDNPFTIIASRLQTSDKAPRLESSDGCWRLLREYRHVGLGLSGRFFK